MSTGIKTPKDKYKLESKTVLAHTDQKPSSKKTTETIKMDKISQTILKLAIEAIPLLTLDNYIRSGKIEFKMYSTSKNYQTDLPLQMERLLQVRTYKFVQFSLLSWTHLCKST